MYDFQLATGEYKCQKCEVQWMEEYKKNAEIVCPNKNCKHILNEKILNKSK